MTQLDIDHIPYAPRSARDPRPADDLPQGPGVVGVALLMALIIVAALGAAVRTIG